MVQAVALGGISVRFEESVVRPEHVVCFFRGALEDDYHEGAHKERSINHLVGFLRRAVVENSIRGIVFVLQKSGELTGKPMDHRQVERPEIFIEGEVSQVIVNVEEEGVLVVLRWLRTGHPVELVYNIGQHIYSLRHKFQLSDGSAEPKF